MSRGGLAKVARLTGATVVGDVFDIPMRGGVGASGVGARGEGTRGEGIRGVVGASGGEATRGGRARGGVGTNACRVRVLPLPSPPSKTAGPSTRASDEVLVEVKLVGNENNDHHNHNNHNHNHNHNHNRSNNNRSNNHNHSHTTPSRLPGQNLLSGSTGVVSVLLTASTHAQAQTLNDRFMRSLHRLRSIYSTKLRLNASGQGQGLGAQSQGQGLAGALALVVMPGAGVPEMLVLLQLDREIIRVAAQMDVYRDQQNLFTSKHARAVERQLLRLDEVR